MELCNTTSIMECNDLDISSVWRSLQLLMDHQLHHAPLGYTYKVSNGEGRRGKKKKKRQLSLFQKYNWNYCHIFHHCLICSKGRLQIHEGNWCTKSYDSSIIVVMAVGDIRWDLKLILINSLIMRLLGLSNALYLEVSLIDSYICNFQFNDLNPRSEAHGTSALRVFPNPFLLVYQWKTWLQHRVHGSKGYF